MDETDTFNTRLPGELVARVDAWRLRQAFQPSRAAAVRWLIERGLREQNDGKWLTDKATVVDVPGTPEPVLAPRNVFVARRDEGDSG